MIFSGIAQFRFLARGILLILICATINLQYCSVKAATLHNSRSANVRDKETCQNFCQSPICIQEVNFFSTIMNQTVDPCDDFYQFTCGNFIKKVVIPDVGNVVNMLGTTQYEVSNLLYSDLKEGIKPNELEAFKKFKIYYKNCLNESQIEENGSKPLFQILDNIGGWPLLLGDNWNEKDFSWKKSVYRINQENFPLFFPVTINVAIDKINSTRTILNVNSASTTITQIFFLDDSKLLTAYRRFVVQTAVALGSNENEVSKEIEELINFEMNLYKIKTPAEKLADEKGTGNQMTIKELSQKHPNIPWLELFNKVLNKSGVFIDNNQIINISDPEYIFKLEKLLQITPKRVVANFLAWQVVGSMLTLMPHNLNQILSDFLNIMQGTKVTLTREARCTSEIMQGFSIALSSIYVRKHFNREIKGKVYELIEDIRSQTKKNLEEVDWMDDITRKAALEKLEAMRFFVGYADELMEDKKVNAYYKDLEIKPGNYLNSVFSINSFLRTINYKSLKTSVDKNSWLMRRSSIFVNAFYMHNINSIEIPAGILRGVFYQLDRPQYLNYGAFGTVIGHEITHGFDNTGRTYDKHGNNKDWWQPDTNEKFLQKSQCIIDQYNNFTIKEVGLHVNGIITQGENIADNGGFKAAYQAYNEWVKRNNIVESCLPNLNYTPRQLFWISAASNWCSKQRPEYLKNLISTDEHSPDSARVIITFSNIKEFAEDFQCKPGSRMNPEKKCVLW